MKKGFTLIELIIIIAVLGLLAIFTYPKITEVIENSKIKAREQTILSLKTSLSTYLVTFEATTSIYPETFDISTLVSEKYLKDKDIIDPLTEEKISGCLTYRWDVLHNQYIIEYLEVCETKTPYNYVLEKYPNIKYGDINLDGNVNMTDITLLKQYLENSTDEVTTEQQIFALDLNLDGKIDSSDEKILLGYIKNSYSELPYIGE